MKEKLIAFKHFEEDHTGEELSKLLISELEKLEIAPRLLGVTLDNADNNDKMIETMAIHYTIFYPGSGFQPILNQVNCMAHVVNLGAQEILKNFKMAIDAETYSKEEDPNDAMTSALSRLAFLVRKIRNSPKLRRLLKKICKERGIKHLIPIIDVSTRWNSTYDMIDRSLKLKEALTDVFAQFRGKNYKHYFELCLTDDDWTLMQQLLKVLKPLKEVTLFVSLSKKDFSISNVLPLYQYCIDSLQEESKKHKKDDDITIGINAAVQKLIHYYDNLSPIVGVALILNPAMKLKFLKSALAWKEEWIKIVEENFKSCFAYYKDKLNFSNNVIEQKEDTEHGKEQNANDYYSYLNKKQKLNGEVSQNPNPNEEEYDRYFREPPVPPNLNILQYWKTNFEVYPILATLARDYITVQASSVPAERIFSSGADLVTAERCSLKGETIEMVQFLKHNL